MSMKHFWAGILRSIVHYVARCYGLMLCLYVDVVSQFQAHNRTYIHRHTCTHTYTHIHIHTCTKTNRGYGQPVSSPHEHIHTYTRTHAQKLIVDMVSLFQAYMHTYIHTHAHMHKN